MSDLPDHPDIPELKWDRFISLPEGFGKGFKSGQTARMLADEMINHGLASLARSSRDVNFTRDPTVLRGMWTRWPKLGVALCVDAMAVLEVSTRPGETDQLAPSGLLVWAG